MCESAAGLELLSTQFSLSSHEPQKTLYDFLTFVLVLPCVDV